MGVNALTLNLTLTSDSDSVLVGKQGLYKYGLMRKSSGEVRELCVRPKEGPIDVHSLEATVEDD